ncbi:MAG: 30S ribosomal protein S17 [Acidobacteriota bacterium]
MAEENQEETSANESEISNLKSAIPEVKTEGSGLSAEARAAGNDQAADGNGKKRAHRSQKVGVITSDKMLKTVVVRVDRLVRHTKYRRYVRRTSKFMAHDELGATVGDKVRIVETRPMSARKRWRVIEIVQKAAK